MTAHPFNYSWLACDGCGDVYKRPGRRVNELRALAAADGWRHRQQLYARSNWPRQLDLCPRCPEVLG